MAKPAGLTTTELQDMTIFRISRTFRLLNTLMQRRMQMIGLTDGQFRVLNATCALDNPNVADLVSYADLGQPVVSQALKQLEAKGLITRTVDADDGRARRPAPTPEGLRIFGLGSAELRAVEADLNQWLGPSAEAMRDQLDILLEAAGELVE